VFEAFHMTASVQKHEATDAHKSFSPGTASSRNMNTYPTEAAPTEAKPDKRLRNWLILANVAAWIAIIAAIRYLIY
jgi:hypothetical protein